MPFVFRFYKDDFYNMCYIKRESLGYHLVILGNRDHVRHMFLCGTIAALFRAVKITKMNDMVIYLN